MAESGASRDRVNQLGRFHSKGVSEFYDIDEAYISLAAFDSAHIIPMQIGQLSQLLLRKFACFSQPSETFSEQ